MVLCMHQLGLMNLAKLGEPIRGRLWPAKDRSTSREHSTTLTGPARWHFSMSSLPKQTPFSCSWIKVWRPPPLPEHDPRAKLKVLRLLLTAGLMTPERDHRHRRQAGVTRCACGRGAPTIEHISWKCGLFKEQRAPAQRIITRYRRLPTCFRLCTLVPSSLRMPVEEVKTVQAALLKIWQRHISDWGDDPTDPAIIHLPSVPPAASSSSDHHEPPPVPPQDDPQLQPMSRNGHVLQLLPTGGAFCRKCGKQTKIIKHLRLNILGKRCKFASLPPQQWA